MDGTSLMLSLLFGTIGVGYVMFGKKAERMSPLISGAALIVIPYFISNVILLIVVGLALMVVPFVHRAE
jgi:hypothetical protein